MNHAELAEFRRIVKTTLKIRLRRGDSTTRDDHDPDDPATEDSATTITTDILSPFRFATIKSGSKTRFRSKTDRLRSSALI